jgi:hypothetical protein
MECLWSVRYEEVDRAIPAEQCKPRVRAFTAVCSARCWLDATLGPKYVPPTMTAPAAFKESPTQFKETDGWTVAQPQDATLRGKWWEIYNEPELNALEDQLNIDNQNIRQAFENFMEARALVREARSQYFPTVSVGGRRTRGRRHLPTLGPGSGGSTGTTLRAANSRRCFLFRPMFRGSPICGGRCATQCAPANTTPN